MQSKSFNVKFYVSALVGVIIKVIVVLLTSYILDRTICWILEHFL